MDIFGAMRGEKVAPRPWNGVLEKITEPPMLGPVSKPKLLFRPFNSDESVSNPDGTYSTERTVTIQTPEGWANVPSLWMGPNGPLDLATIPDPEAGIQQMLRMYEGENGQSFGRFKSLDEAVSNAKVRSSKGGSHSGMKR